MMHVYKNYIFEKQCQEYLVCILNKLSKYTLIILAAVATTSTSMTTTASIEKSLSDHGSSTGQSHYSW